MIQKCTDIKIREKALIDPKLTLDEFLIFARSRKTVFHQTACMMQSSVTSTPATAETSYQQKGPNEVNQALDNYVNRHNRGRRIQGQHPSQNTLKKCTYCSEAWHNTSQNNDCPAYNVNCEVL